MLFGVNGTSESDQALLDPCLLVVNFYYSKRYL